MVKYWHKNRHKPIEQNQEARKKPSHKQLMFGKGAAILFNKWCWENWVTTHRSMKLDLYFIPLTKTNFKWIRDLNLRP